MNIIKSILKLINVNNRNTETYNLYLESKLSKINKYSK